ncbi:hypothetical protein C8R45DRAFT_825694 [Mycena sanguinolenta]|nr:hypothetical protein C8R45DRAFT_825694 [Mycena sanguinolenta]
MHSNISVESSSQLSSYKATVHALPHPAKPAKKLPLFHPDTRSFITSNAFAFVALTLAIFSMKSNAQFTAFSGDECTGNRGADAPCNGGCDDFSGRRSFVIDATAPPIDRCITVYSDDACQNPVSRWNGTGPTGARPGICIEVSTGTPQLTFTCASNVNCSPIN